MIVVTVGTNEARFDRLLAAVDDLPGDEEIVVQHGPSPVRPRGARCVDYLSFDELCALVAGARVVVTHAGVGSILTALRAGRRPVVMARLHRHGEAVDDHQLPLARRLHDAGLVTLVSDASELGAAVRRRAEPEDGRVAPGAADGALAGELRAYLGELGIRRDPRAGRAR